ncbi:hypothetical protein PanWU01x14_364910 [Parasponia andersonii]|uniref:Uncharacterized protein n=1 Tax=Parasponia andersonii TaxID=3476 RepID=A0A2P5A659_PARAD|nr:hypothetical protein PanWU01x14_364910 [Parasponia andersonii]
MKRDGDLIVAHDFAEHVHCAARPCNAHCKGRGIPDMLRPLVLREVTYERTILPDPDYLYFGFLLKVIFKVYGANTGVGRFS